MTRAAYNSNRILFLMMLMMMLLTTTQFSPRLFAGERTAETRSLTIDCQDRHISQRDAGWLMGTDNFSQTYARRAGLHADIARACARGVAAVRVEMAVPTAPTRVPARR